MKSLILSIDGMTCSACSNGLEKYLNKQNGIFNSSVNLVMANATITYDEKILNQEKIEKYIKQAGFKSLGVFKKINTKKNSKKEKIQFIIFTILAIILMYIAMGHMVGLPIINFLSPHNNPINYTMCLLILAIAFLIYGYDILKNGYKNLIHKIPNMDTLVAIGVISSFAYSLYGVFMIFKGNLHYVVNLYFESSAIIIYFVKLGRYIDKISKDKTKEAIQKLVEITPNQAIIEVNGVQKQVTLDEIKKGDIVISKAGDKIAVDGEIIEGNAHLDESFITGESKPVAKSIGEKVIAGSLNYDGFIKYKAERIGKESTISEIVKLVIEASNTKAPIAKIADKISGYFVPTVIVIAIITFVSYLFLGYDIKTALSTFITVLVVACPCSLGLATPLAIVISEGLCAGNGILVKKSEILENASKINTIVFDKTGTLTYGKLKISKIYNYSNLFGAKYGLRSALLIILTVVACVLSEYVFEKITKRESTLDDLSAVVTGMILALNLPCTFPYWKAMLGGFFAIVIVKQLFGGLGQNFMNPALAARCFLLIAYTGPMTNFVCDAYSGATPLAILKPGSEVVGQTAPTLLTMFIGKTSGVIGETSVIAILIGAIIMILLGVIDLKIPASYIITFAVFMFLFGAQQFDINYVVAELCGGGLMLGAFFMATDYVTSPITPKGQIVFGVLLGVLTGIFRIFGASAEGVSYAIIICNLLVPLIEKVTIPVPFGKEGIKDGK